MKKLNRFAALAAIILLLVMGCKVEPDAIAVERVSLSETTLTLEPAMTRRLTATITPDNADDKTVKWSSSDKKVALVGSDGTIGAFKEGMTIITAQAGDKTAMCIVTVKSAVAVESITLSETTLTLTPAMTRKLTATVTPYNADATVTWSSSRNDIATVDNYGTVRAYAEGTTTITAQAGNKATKCTVTVKSSLTAVESVSLNTTTLPIEPGTTRMLTATVTPSNADATVTWSSSDNDIAMVYNDGTVRAYAEGTATITAQAGDKTATCTVTVHFHSYSGGICTVCGAVQNFNGTIDENGVLTKYLGNEATVIIPDSVTSIGNYAFYNCESLTSVTISDSVTSIGNYAFGSCQNLTTVTIGNGVESIEEYAFSGCMSLTNVTIPDGVTSIGRSAFEGCTSLTNVTIPDSVTSIGEDAFNNCTSLDSVFFSGTKERWNQIFQNSEMSGCDIVQCTDGYWLNPNYWIIEDGVLTHYYGNKATVEIPDSVTRIGSSAFFNRESLASVTIPTSVTSIDDYAFQYCISLTSVTIPTSVTSIGIDAFYSYTSLAEIQFEGTKAQWKAIEGSDNVDVICVRCSDGNIGNPEHLVTSVTLDKDTLTLTRNETAKLTATVTSSNADDTTVTWTSSDMSVATVDNDGTVTAYAEGTATITAKAGDSIATCTVTVHIHTYSGGKCTVCGAVQYFNGMINDNGVLMYYYGNEATVVIPDSVTSIGNSAFRNCTGLTSVTIPDSVTSIGDDAFYNCNGLTSVTYTGTLAGWCAIDFLNYYANPLANKKAILYISNLPVTDAQIPNNATEIKNYAFGGYTNLTSVTIPDSVTSIGNSVFCDCTNLTSVTIPDSVTSIGNSVFCDCTSLTSVTIPDSVTSIGDYAFYNCTRLMSVTIPNGVTSIGSGAFGYTSLTNVTIPDSVTSIENVVFYNCTRLTSVTIPDNVTSIGNSAFCNCTGLTSVTIGNGVTSIEGLAFDNCTSLTSVTIGNSVTSIGESVFSNCTSLAEIQFNGTKAQWKAIKGSNNVTVACVRCSDDNIGNQENPILVNNIILDKNTLTLIGNETAKLTATVTPSNADDKTVTWSSSDSSVAKVDNNGTVTAVKAGTATITAKAGDKKATCTVTVNPIPVNKVTLDKDTLTLTRGKTAKLTATVTPNNADDKTVTWSSSDEMVATVDNNGTVTAVKEGTATITARAGGKTATCKVTVPVNNVMLDKYTLTLKRNETAKLTATVYPDNADNKTVTWTSSNISVATVDNDGTVTAVEAGYATITARVGDKTAQCTVHIHFYSGGKCTLCGDVPQLTGGTIDENGVLTKYKYENNSLLIFDLNIDIPEGVTGIGDRAFEQATSNLKSVTIPDSVTYIGNAAFQNCRGLKSVTIPSSVTSIGNNAFLWCESLTSVIYTGTLADWCAIDFSSGSANPLSNKNVILYIKDSQVTDANIPNNVTEINYAFYGYTSLTNVTIPTSVTSIGDRAFWSCTSLTNVTIPTSVTSIGNSAFMDCTSLTSVTIPNSVTSIGAYAFYGCSGLTSVTIPDSVTTIRETTFGWCTGLTSVRIPNSVKYFIETSIFAECTALKDVYYDGTKDEWNKISNSREIGLPDDATIHGTNGTTWKYKE